MWRRSPESGGSVPTAVKDPSHPLEWMSLAVFAASCATLGVLYGIVAVSMDSFPVPQLRYALQQIDAVVSETERSALISIPGDGSRTRLLKPDAVARGLIMVTGVSEDLANFVRIVDRSGAVVHEWRPDWFGLPTAELSLPDDNRRPQTKPGATLHGALVLSTGDVVFNLDHLATIRLDACGNARWILSNLGHHSISLDDDGNLWIPGERFVSPGEDAGFANHKGPLRDWIIQKISPEGAVLSTISAIDILTRNDLLGLLHLSNIHNETTGVRGDTLHLNDAEIFPRRMPEGIFRHGDLMISLRNINTVLVVDPESLKIRYRTTGAFLRQHDPEFVSGNRIIVFDNRNLTPWLDPKLRRSRILSIDAAGDSVNEVFPLRSGGFFTDIMGKQQLLPNGNLLITVAWEGRAIEVTPDGETAWEYVNTVGSESRGVVTQARLLPAEMDAAFFQERRLSCLQAQARGGA